MTNVTVLTPEFIAWFDKAKTIAGKILGVIEGKRYFKIVEKDGGVFAFIDKNNGDVLKPASWSAPAKHARGNIFAPDGGINCVGKYGIAYLR
jgi:hypothetical protein